MQILETKRRKTNKIKREEREDLHTFSDTTVHSVHNINEHTAGVGADSSRPYNRLLLLSRRLAKLL